MKGGKACSHGMCHCHLERLWMTLQFTYMGTKRQLASEIANVIAQAPDGPVLDAFAGMSAVGTAVGPERTVWCNDVQHFACSVATSFFTARFQPKLTPKASSECQKLFENNRMALKRSFASILARERRAHHSEDLQEICEISSHLTKRSQSMKSVKTRLAYQLGQKQSPYCLFSITYAGGYVGLEQAIDIDSLRYAIDGLSRQELITSETRDWMLIALCRSLGKVSNSTGHFAQYLAVKRHTKKRFLAKRRRSIWSEWQNALDNMRPLGTREWRRSNRVYHGEAIDLLRRLSRCRVQPTVIYCDPPYTSDHYSRYYHLLETLLLYDYPKIESKGQYRLDRFYSPFSIKSKVEQSFKDLIGAAARMEATLILSYPDHGLLPNPRECLVQLLRERYSKVEIAGELAHEHSTLGASNGIESSPVIELVFVARS